MIHYYTVRRKFINEQLPLKFLIGDNFEINDKSITQSVYYTINPDTPDNVRFARISDHHPNLKNYIQN